MSGATTGRGRLEGKTALVTGAGAGIGAATALAFCAEGAQVLLVDRDGAALERQLEAVRASLPEARVAAFQADVGTEAQSQMAVGEVLRVFGRLDILVNNAARRNYAAVADATAADWHEVLDVNLLGTASFCRAALPALRRSGKGSIVNVSSCYAVSGRKGMAIYDASKAALLALTRTLAHEEAQHGVRANAVCPGATLTDFQVAKAQAAGTAMEDLLAARKDTSLLGRWAGVDEVARPILWLASDEGSYITATTLMVDGGLHAM
jgi:meso-butanediol dehydrogenase/(S,S)-butanediol dehydrogenase/diacetyl reductase